jgi:hypothetical protein
MLKLQFVWFIKWIMEKVDTGITPIRLDDDLAIYTHIKGSLHPEPPKIGAIIVGEVREILLDVLFNVCLTDIDLRISLFLFQTFWSRYIQILMET